MIPFICEPGPTLSSGDIEDIEKKYCVRLPDDYKAFLLKYNGGIPEPAAFSIQGFDDNPYDEIQVLYRINGAVESSNIGADIRAIEQLPLELFPIACTSAHDLVCLVVSDTYAATKNSVVYWDYHAAWGKSGKVYSVYPIARTFTDFLESFRELPE